MDQGNRKRNFGEIRGFSFRVIHGFKGMTDMENIPHALDTGNTLVTGRHRRQRFFPLTEQDESLLPQLSPRYVEILRQEGQMADIASRLNLPVGTVKSRLHRARAALTALRRQQSVTPQTTQ